MLIGLAAITTGLGGVFANLVYGEGYLAALGLGISLVTLMLGLILIYMGLSNKWSY
jgi:vacuolar-type H+-ATPase subunit I/STV1